MRLNTQVDKWNEDLVWKHSPKDEMGFRQLMILLATLWAALSNGLSVTWDKQETVEHMLW